MTHLLQTDATGSTCLFPNPLLEVSAGLGGDPPPGFSFAREFPNLIHDPLAIGIAIWL